MNIHSVIQTETSGEASHFWYVLSFCWGFHDFHLDPLERHHVTKTWDFRPSMDGTKSWSNVSTSKYSRTCGVITFLPTWPFFLGGAILIPRGIQRFALSHSPKPGFSQGLQLAIDILIMCIDIIVLTRFLSIMGPSKTSTHGLLAELIFLTKRHTASTASTSQHQTKQERQNSSILRSLIWQFIADKT